jgi:hypothetical protein
MTGPKPTLFTGLGALALLLALAVTALLVNLLAQRPTMLAGMRIVVAWGEKSETTMAKGLVIRITNPLLFLAPRPGLEPGTYGLTVRRSTD